MSFIFFILLASLFQPSIKAQAKGKTYVLVHGGWHGAWSWNKVVPLLEAKGNQVIAIDLSGHGEDKTPISSVSLQDCVKKVVSAVNTQPG